VKIKKFPAKSSKKKELCTISASVSSFQLEDGAKTPRIIVRRSKEIICKLLRPSAVRQPLAYRSHGNLWPPTSTAQNAADMGHPATCGGANRSLIARMGNPWPPTSAAQNAVDMGHPAWCLLVLRDLFSSSSFSDSPTGRPHPSEDSPAHKSIQSRADSPAPAHNRDWKWR